MTLDECNRQILETVANQPRYKSEICRRITYDASTAVVSRRVDTLVENGYLTQTLVTPDHFTSGFLDGYKLTEQGRRQIHGNEQGDT